MALPSKVPSTVEALQCPQCGAPLVLRNPHQSRTVVCSSCHSVRDARDPGLAALWSYSDKLKFPPAIPLGARGTFDGAPWECLGMLVRRTIVEGTTYGWTEYLLWNPFRGYRWLVESLGHWVLVRPLLWQPDMVSGDRRTNAVVEGVEYKCFQTCEATVLFVLGEFYWQVEKGERATVSDYIAPPRLVSREQTAGEINWSISESITPEAVRDAFGGKVVLPAPLGVGPASPNPFEAEATNVMSLMWQFMAVALAVQLLFFAFSQNKKVLTWSEGFSATDTEKSRVSPYFELTGRPSGVMVHSSANVDNHWVWLSCALINEETQVAYDFGREISYYHGYDSDGSWSEGSTTDEAWLPGVPSGKYYLRVEPQSDLPAARYTIEVTRDPPRTWPFWVSIALLLIPPFIVVMRRYSYEVTRWSESDYPMMQSSNDED